MRNYPITSSCLDCLLLRFQDFRLCLKGLLIFAFLIYLLFLLLPRLGCLYGDAFCLRGIRLRIYLLLVVSYDLPALDFWTRFAARRLYIVYLEGGHVTMIVFLAYTILSYLVSQTNSGCWAQSMGEPPWSHETELVA